MFYERIERILKQFSRFAIYEWCFINAMVPVNAEHVAAAQDLLLCSGEFRWYHCRSYIKPESRELYCQGPLSSSH